MSPVLGAIPAGRQAWRQTMEVRERFLAAGDPARLPPPACGVRREIVMSWRRSLLSGVDPAATTLPRDEGTVPSERLDRAARPVIDRLSGQLAGMPAWSFLTDRECRLVRYVVGDRTLIPQLEARGAVPGARFGEDAVGTNGLGTAVEERQPFIVAGSEHFRAYESEVTTAGAPVRDPVTRRLVGVLNVNCPYQLTNGLMLPFITELANSIEARLAAAMPLADRVLVDEFLRVSSRCPDPVVAVSREVFIANAAALAFLDGADHQVLWQWACDAPARDAEHTARLRLTSDRAVTARLRPLAGSAGRAAVVTLTPASEPKTAVGPAAWPSCGERVAAQLDRARRARLPVLLEGERGTGKTVLARTVHDRAGGPGLLPSWTPRTLIAGQADGCARLPPRSRIRPRPSFCGISTCSARHWSGLRCDGSTPRGPGLSLPLLALRSWPSGSPSCCPCRRCVTGRQRFPPWSQR